jgi:hypothetical protein
LADLIINVNETNVDFNPSRITSFRIGERLVSAHINGNSGSCTVLLAFMMSGIKLPALVIWKGVLNGRIESECRGPLYQYENIKHAVQIKSLLDSEKYQTWVREMLAVYLNGRFGYLLQDPFSVHLKDENIMAGQRAKVEADFILAGYMQCLQVLGKGDNKPFKQFIQQECIAWVQEVPHGAKPDHVTITSWVFYSFMHGHL